MLPACAIRANNLHVRCRSLMQYYSRCRLPEPNAQMRAWRSSSISLTAFNTDQCMQASGTQLGYAVSRELSEADAAAAHQGHAFNHSGAVSSPGFFPPSISPFQRPFSLPESSIQANSPLSVHGPRSVSVNLPDISPMLSHRAFHRAAQGPGAGTGHGLRTVCSPGTRMSSASSRARPLAAAFMKDGHQLLKPSAEAAGTDSRLSQPAHAAHVSISQQHPWEARAEDHSHASSRPRRPIMTLPDSTEGHLWVAAQGTINHHTHVRPHQPAARPLAADPNPVLSRLLEGQVLAQVLAHLLGQVTQAS